GRPATAPVAKELNSKRQLDDVPQERTEYVVKVVEIESPPQTSVWLEGGEALELSLETSPGSTGRALVHHRYAPDQPAAPFKKVTTGPMPRAGVPVPEEFWIAAHIPLLNRQTNNADFFISV